MRLMLMPFFSPIRLTVPVTEVSSVMSPPSRVWNRIGRRKLDMPTCWICALAPTIRLDGPFCRSGIEAR